MRTPVLAAALLMCLCTTASATRTRMPLECFDRTTLRYVDYRHPWAMVLSPDNVMHRAKVGDHLGLSDGRVVRITAERIDILELVPDGDGGWVDRAVSVPRREKETASAVDPDALVDHCVVTR